MTSFDIPFPTNEKAAKDVIIYTVRKISNIEIDPIVGATYIYNKISIESNETFPDTECVGDHFCLEKLFAWLKEYWDCLDGSKLLYYADLPRKKSKTKLINHIVEEAAVIFTTLIKQETE